MKILHITNDYSGSGVYKNLVGELDQLGLSQIVYNPIRERGRIGKNKIVLEVEDSEIVYSHILDKTTDRIFYKKKIKKIVKDIEARVDLSQIQYIHAHTWYSDGGVAYLLAEKYKIPYIIAVRNTDLNVHYKYFIQHRGFGRKILKGAEKVVFIAKYQEAFFNARKLLNLAIKRKSTVIPNGVDPFWIDHAKPFVQRAISPLLKILYVGTFIKRKRLLELQHAIIELSTKHKLTCQLHIVGGGGAQSERIVENIKRFPHLFDYHGKIEDKERLMEIYNGCLVFAMPSKHETFGLVYVEAMLQGLPILYTANDGIDGFYDEKIGEKVTFGGVEEIKEKLLTLSEKYHSYTIPTEKLIENHNWKNIALTYHGLYNTKE